MSERLSASDMLQDSLPVYLSLPLMQSYLIFNYLYLCQYLILVKLYSSCLCGTPFNSKGNSRDGFWASPILLQMLILLAVWILLLLVWCHQGGCSEELPCRQGKHRNSLMPSRPVKREVRFIEHLLTPWFLPSALFQRDCGYSRERECPRYCDKRSGLSHRG